MLAVSGWYAPTGRRHAGHPDGQEEPAMDDAFVVALALAACGVITIFTLGPFGVLLGGVLLLVAVGFGIAKLIGLVAGWKHLPH
jgi:hypothetical protein